MMAAGTAMGNAQLASAGAQTVASGRSALAAGASAMTERAREGRAEARSDATHQRRQQEARDERARDAAAREAAKAAPAAQASGGTTSAASQTAPTAATQAPKGTYTDTSQNTSPGNTQGSVPPERGLPGNAAMAGGSASAPTSGGPQGRGSMPGQGTLPSSAVSGSGRTPPTSGSAYPATPEDKAAVARQYQAVQQQGGMVIGGERQYVSPQQVQWIMEQSGSLPSQKAENDRRVNAHAASTGKTVDQARADLTAQGGLVHQEAAPQSPPEAFASEGDDMQVMQATHTHNSAEQVKADADPAYQPRYQTQEQTHAQLRQQHALTSQAATKAQDDKTIDMEGGNGA